MYTLLCTAKKTFMSKIGLQMGLRHFSLLLPTTSSLFSSSSLSFAPKPVLLAVRYKGEKFELKRNQEIKYEIIQIETESEAGDRVMARVTLEEAVAMGTRVGQDVVLVDETTMPPTCEMGNYRKISKRVKKALKDLQPKATKEIQIRSVIADHDLNTKLKSIVKLLAKNHPIKLLLSSTSAHLNESPYAMDDIIKKIEIHIKEREEDGAIAEAHFLPRKVKVNWRREVMIYPQAEAAAKAKLDDEAKAKRAEDARKKREKENELSEEEKQQHAEEMAMYSNSSDNRKSRADGDDDYNSGIEAEFSEVVSSDHKHQ